MLFDAVTMAAYLSELTAGNDGDMSMCSCEYMHAGESRMKALDSRIVQQATELTILACP
jgi:hypothetical protein